MDDDSLLRSILDTEFVHELQTHLSTKTCDRFLNTV